MQVQIPLGSVAGGGGELLQVAAEAAGHGVPDGAGLAGAVFCPSQAGRKGRRAERVEGDRPHPGPLPGGEGNMGVEDSGGGGKGRGWRGWLARRVLETCGHAWWLGQRPATTGVTMDDDSR
jgi:hypothetical protein